jgi:hypothetical protein
MPVYDKAEWYFSAPIFPSDLAPLQAFVRAGMFFGYLVERGLASPDWVQSCGRLVAEFKRRDLTGAKLLAQSNDGIFESSMLTPEGNSFTQHYFDKDKGRYFEDFKQVLAYGLPSVFHVRDSWSNYDKMKQRIEQRYLEWKGPRRFR